MRVAMLPGAAEEEITTSLAGLAEVDLRVCRGRAEFIDAFRECELAVLASASYDDQVARALAGPESAVRTVQLLNAGHEQLERFGVPAHVTVCNAGDAWSPAVAEHVLATILALYRAIPDFVLQQRQGLWSRGVGEYIRMLQGDTVLIVGYGSVGYEVARRVRALGAHPIAVARSPRGADDAVARVHGLNDLPGLLARSDVVVLCVPSSASTRRMFVARELALMKTSAVLVNVARGDVIDTAAVIGALHAGTIAGAALDVTDPEPLPPTDPAWSCPNLLITPHVAGIGGQVSRDRLAAVVADTVSRLISGQPPRHVVRPVPNLVRGRAGGDHH